MSIHITNEERDNIMKLYRLNHEEFSEILCEHVTEETLNYHVDRAIKNNIQLNIDTLRKAFQPGMHFKFNYHSLQMNEAWRKFLEYDLVGDHETSMDRLHFLDSIRDESTEKFEFELIDKFEAEESARWITYRSGII